MCSTLSPLCGQAANQNSCCTSVKADVWPNLFFFCTKSSSVMLLMALQKGGEKLGYESEAFAIYDTMKYIKPSVRTLCVGTAFGESAMLLAAGEKACQACCQFAVSVCCSLSCFSTTLGIYRKQPLRPAHVASIQSLWRCCCNALRCCMMMIVAASNCRHSAAWC